MNERFTRELKGGRVERTILRRLSITRTWPSTRPGLKTPPLPAGSRSGNGRLTVSVRRRVITGCAREPARVPRHLRRILFFGTYDARRHDSVRVLRNGLAALGNEIVECKEPLNVSTAERVRMLRQPWRLPVFAFRLLVAWARLWRHARRMPA